MLVERIFGMLKGRFRILLKRIDNPLYHMLDLMTTCICLHNMCIANLNGFDMNFSTFCNIKGVDLFKVAKKIIK
jgi:hypothetical protein